MVVYTVRPGDSLSSVAGRFGLSQSHIVLCNGLSDPARLSSGQCLLLVSPAVTASGDSLSKIAQRFGVTKTVLLQYNPGLHHLHHLHHLHRLNRPGGLSPKETVIVGFSASKRRSIHINGCSGCHIHQELLHRTLPYLTYLTICGYSFTGEGRLISPADMPLIQLAGEYQAAPIMRLRPTDQDGCYSPDLAGSLLSSSGIQGRLLANILTMMERKGYMGLDIDFELIPKGLAESYLAFLDKASALLHDSGFLLHITLPIAATPAESLMYDAPDYAAIAPAADLLTLNTWGGGGQVSPAAPFPLVRQIAEQGAGLTGAEKLLLGLPNYALSWALPHEPGVSYPIALSNQQAPALAAKHGAHIHFEEGLASSTFLYAGPKETRRVWFQDARGLEQCFDLIDRLAIRGLSCWNLHRAFQQSWSFAAARYNIEKLV